MRTRRSHPDKDQTKKDIKKYQDDIMASVNISRKQKDDLEEQNASILLRIKQDGHELDKLGEEKQVLCNELKSIKDDIKQVNTDLKKKQNEFYDMSDQVQHLDEILELHKQQNIKNIQDAKNEFREFERDMDEKKKSIKNDIEDLNKEKNKIHNDIQESNNIHDFVSNSIQKSKNELDEIEWIIFWKNKDIDALQDIFNALEEKQQVMSNDIEKLSHDQSSLIKDIDSQYSKLYEVSKQLQEKEDFIDNMSHMEKSLSWRERRLNKATVHIKQHYEKAWLKMIL